MKDLVIEPTNNDNYFRVFCRESKKDDIVKALQPLEYISDIHTDNEGMIGVYLSKLAEDKDIEELHALLNCLVEEEKRPLVKKEIIDKVRECMLHAQGYTTGKITKCGVEYWAETLVDLITNEGNHQTEEEAHAEQHKLLYDHFEELVQDWYDNEEHAEQRGTVLDLEAWARKQAGGLDHKRH